MNCPKCNEKTKVINSRYRKMINVVWRGRKCSTCNRTFHTEEMLIEAPRIVSECNSLTTDLKDIIDKFKVKLMIDFKTKEKQ